MCTNGMNNNQFNENSIFNIQKMLFYSSANAVDNTEEQSLQNLSISQYTDISIYIDNTSISIPYIAIVPLSFLYAISNINILINNIIILDIFNPINTI